MARSTRWGRSAEILVITVLFHSKMARAVSNGGDDKDEFANNLFSDLAPLLALFGERVAQQFLSEAVSNWSDSIIFAMAPIGILTAVIGAIRAGAPNWVKALVGRSRESSAVVELELLSSTSTDVCEMWNGGAIVRIMGSPPILQLIGIEGATEEKDKFLTLDCEGFKREATRELFKHHTAIDDGETGADSGGTTQYQLIAGQSPKHVGPNISLNLNLHKNRKTLELRAFACVGILIQLAVPAYTALITYHPKHEKLKKGEHVAKYAYPLTIIGMGLVSFGMIICATVIGRKTREYTWTWWEESKRKNLRILWIQKQATVNDQVFDSYAIISPNACNFVMTSWPSNLHLNQQRKTTGLSQVAPSQRLGNHSHNLRQRNPIPTITPAIGLQRRASSIEPQKVQHSGAVYGFLHGRWPETVWTLIGAFAGLAGFIVQFVGMRAMQADAAIAQLIATGVMVAVRAVIRRQPKMRPLAVRLDPDFELDWLAEASYQGASKIWEYNQNDCEKPSKVEIGHCCGYGETPSGSLVHSLQPWDDRFVQTNDVQHLLHGRVYLRQLSLWPSKGVRTATALARAIEVVMDTLFPLDSGGDFAKYRWPINVTRDGTANGTDTEEIYFTIERKGKAKTWAASLPEIEAALSLRLYALHKRSHTSIRHTNYLDAIEKEGRASVEQSINLLCPNTQSARRDFEWWLPGGSAILEASLEPCTTKSPDSMSFNMNKYSNIEVKPERILGYRLNQRNFGRDLYTFATTRFEPDKFHDPTNKQDEHRAPWLASLTYAPIENAIAQDWFSAFLWSAASATTCHKIDHCNTRTRPKDIREVETRPHWSAFCLEDSSITTMAESFHESGLGTLRDGYMRVIASLSYHDKLPDAESELFRLSREHAKKLLLEQEFKEAGKLYLWLFRTSMTFGRRSSQATRGTALLLECFRYLSVISEMRMYELQEGAMVKNNSFG
ncbi:hypothetical protein DFH27DRAFT_64201 [Peziza echinospora]|nr:hypothetical protein DFH27DRAFT_64201 [Peziza echinospora]